MTSRKARIGGVSFAAIAMSLAPLPAFADTLPNDSHAELVEEVLHLVDTGQVTLTNEEIAVVEGLNFGESAPQENPVSDEDWAVLTNIQDRSNTPADVDPDPTDDEEPTEPEPDPTEPEPDPTDPDPDPTDPDPDPDPTDPEPTDPPTEEPDPTDPPTEEPDPTDPPTEEPEPTDPPTEEPEPTDPPTEEPEPTDPPTEEPGPDPTPDPDPAPANPDPAEDLNASPGTSNTGGVGNTIRENAGSLFDRLNQANRGYGTGSIIPRQVTQEQPIAEEPVEELPLTGSSAEYQAALAAGLIVAGTGALYGSRKKGKHAR